MKNILFIGGTHGNESIGVETLRELEKITSDFDWIIGNQKALELNQRGFESDLNRSAPGDLNSPVFEERRAAEILEQTKNYRYTIDLHGTDAATGLFVIVTNPKKENLKLASQLGIERIVIWRSFSSELKGPMSEFFPCGLEIECGPQKMPLVRKKLLEILEAFVQGKATLIAEPAFYEVYGSLKKCVDVPLQEFTKVTIDHETFFPLLIGSYIKNGITCYKMRRISSPTLS